MTTPDRRCSAQTRMHIIDGQTAATEYLDHPYPINPLLAPPSCCRQVPMDQPEAALAMLNAFVHEESRPAHWAPSDRIQEA